MSTTNYEINELNVLVQEGGNIQTIHLVQRIRGINGLNNEDSNPKILIIP